MTNVVASGCVLVAVVAIAIAAAYNAVLRLSPIRPLPLLLPPPPAAVGPLAPNALLSTHLRRIGSGLLPEPEDVAVDSYGFLFVGCADGWIKRVDPRSGAVENWVHLGDGHRPLGLAFGLHGELIVCDVDKGLLNVTKGRMELLSQEAQGVKFMLTDAAVVCKEDGTIYFTDAMDKSPNLNPLSDFVETRASGRLLKYDPATRTSTVILDHLLFPNGVALSSNEDFLVFCETFMARCQRHWIKGEKAGQTEIFLDSLPAFPDNIRSDGKGRFWIALVGARPFYVDLALKYSFLRQLHEVLGLTAFLHDKLTKRALVLAVTEEGVPLLTLGDPTGAAIHSVTSALVVGNDLYLGNLGVDFLGHIKLNATI